jgi:DNA (cytosine-5)-methyltransferase 1
MNCVEICAGAGGQALGLEKAGFDAQVLVEIDDRCCETLLLNRPYWNVLNQDVKEFCGKSFKGIDLFAGGVPCPPFSIAGKQLGPDDERDLFPEAIRLIDEIRPNAIMLENVRGFLDAVFEDYRLKLKRKLQKLGYVVDWRLLNASDYGVSQLRPRVVIVGIKKELSEHFNWCNPLNQNPLSVGELLLDKMQSNGWKGALKWSRLADDIAPTIVGGSKKHGGPDLGPTRAKRAWAALGVNGMTIADNAPDKNFVGMPRLTVDMVAKIQGFPDDWRFSGKKTASYRQVGNAFPPPVAFAVANQIKKCLKSKKLFVVNK